jgi:hypothetical protein
LEFLAGPIKREHIAFKSVLFFLPMNPYMSLLYVVMTSMLSQDTLFLPDDSFLSLYRVFGVTEVFNEILGDYYIVICLCSRGSLSGLFRSIRVLLLPLSDCSTFGILTMPTSTGIFLRHFV